MSRLLISLAAAILALSCTACTDDVEGDLGAVTPPHATFEQLSDRPYIPEPAISAETTELDVIESEQIAPTYEPAHWFKSQGVIEYNGWRVTWYNPLVMGTSHAALGNYTVGQPIVDRGDGIGVVGGLVAVALPAEYPYGSTIDTPFGAGVVVDHSQGAMDVAVFW